MQTIIRKYSYKYEARNEDNNLLTKNHWPKNLHVQKKSWHKTQGINIVNL